MANEFNWDYEETKSDFESEQIPNGDYRLVIRGAEKAMSKDIIKPKKMIKLKLGVSGYAKSLYHYIVFLPDNRDVTNRNLTNACSHRCTLHESRKAHKVIIVSQGPAQSLAWSQTH